MSLPDTPILLFTQPETPSTYFISSSEPPSNPPSASTAEVTSMADEKSEVWKILKKETGNRVRKAICKICPDVSYAFLKNSGTDALTRHIRVKHLQNQPRQIQISTFDGTLSTFSYNRKRGKTNLAKYLIQAEQPFSFDENEAFINFSRTTHNPEYDPFYKDTISMEKILIIL